MKNILEYLEQTVRRSPYKIAVTDGESGMTFREIYDQARAIGSWLHKAGISGKSVAVLLGRQPKTIAAFLGAIYAGSYYVPLDTEMPPYRIKQILASLEPGALICDEKTEDLAKDLACERHVVSYDQAAFGVIREEDLALIRQRQLDIDPIYVVFTSGSTGVPKGVVGCHRSVIDYIEELAPVLKCDEETVFGNQTPLFFDACLKEILPTMKYGACMYLIPRQLFSFPVRLVEYLNRNRINTLCWVVSALTMVSAAGTFERIRPRFLRTVAFASEVFPIRHLKAWQRAAPGARFLNFYGPTETTGICCYYEVDRVFADNETLPIGGPFPNTEILLLDPEGRPVEPGQQGEIYIRGTRLTLGYYRDPERNDQVFVQNPLNSLYPEKVYRTGDLAKYNDRGELVFLSRTDDQIKHMGHRIELGEIEAAANGQPGVESACCVYDAEKKRLTLFYTGKAEPWLLGGKLKERLPKYMMPQNLQRMKEMPRTANGKVDRAGLKQLALRLGRKGD